MVPKVILMNLQTNHKVMVLNNYTALASKYSAMARPNIQIMQVRVSTTEVTKLDELLMENRQSNIVVNFRWKSSTDLSLRQS